MFLILIPSQPRTESEHIRIRVAFEILSKIVCTRNVPLSVSHNFLPFSQPATSPGAPCTPFSRMGLGRKEDDPVFMCHEKFYKEVPTLADIALLENVPEYQQEKMVETRLGSEWGSWTTVLDPRLFGFGCARPRIYTICWRKKHFSQDPRFKFQDILDCLKARPTLTADDYWFLKLPKRQLTDSEDFQLYYIPICASYLLCNNITVGFS